jgi:3-hydroxyisobutyrate dehydrogenase-like beta-hydroxyacid dehydrogenase
MSKIGILHPGEMGVSIAASAINSGHEVFWVSHHRSEKTRARAEKNGLIDLKSLAELCRTCEIIISICPPHAVEDVAKQIIEYGFKGSYLDANAISPERAAQIGKMLGAKNIHLIDGGIIGGQPGSQRVPGFIFRGKTQTKLLTVFQMDHWKQK